MFFLIVPLCVVVMAQEESLISLKDYDFIGEDRRLMSLLDERMAFLDGDLPGAGEDQFNFKASDFSPDFKSGLRRYPKSRGEIKPELRASRPSFNPPHRVTALNSRHLGSRYRNLTGNRRAPVLPFDEHESDLHYEKVLDILRHNIYTVRDSLKAAKNFTKKYEQSQTFRMAYIFNKLDGWKKDIRNLHHGMTLHRHPKYRFKKHLIHYQHALRKNIDVTYTIEFLLHLHTQYTKKVKDLLPKEDRGAIAEWQKKDEMEEEKPKEEK